MCLSVKGLLVALSQTRILARLTHAADDAGEPTRSMEQGAQDRQERSSTSPCVADEAPDSQAGPSSARRTLKLSALPRGDGEDASAADSRLLQLVAEIEQLALDVSPGVLRSAVLRLCSTPRAGCRRIDIYSAVNKNEIERFDVSSYQKTKLYSTKYCKKTRWFHNRTECLLQKK